MDDLNIVLIQSSDIPQHFIRNRIKRDGNDFHLTLLTQDEMKKVMVSLAQNEQLKIKSKDKQVDYIISKAKKDLKDKQQTKDNAIYPYNIGIGKANAQKSNVFYCVILWPETLRFRRNIKLSNNTFYPHITLGFDWNDIHGVNKGIDTILPIKHETEKTTKDYIELLQVLQRFSIKKDSEIVLKVLESLIAELADSKHKEVLCKVFSFRTKIYGQKSRFNECLNDSLEILKMDQFHVPALISQSMALLSMKRPLEAAEMFRFSEKILNLYQNAKGDKNQKISKHRLSLFFGKSYPNKNDEFKSNDDFSTIFEQIKDEQSQWISRINKGLEQCRKDTLTIALNPRIRISIKYPKQLTIPDGEIPENIAWHSTLLPRNFSWIVDGWLCGVSIPKSAEQLKTFEAMNIGLISSFFDDKLSSHKLKGLNRGNVKCIHLKTLNYKAPRLFDIERFVTEAEQCIFVRRKAVLVHCGGGKGRAGTGLACFVIKWGLVFDKQIKLNGDTGKVPKWKQPQKTGSEAIHHIKTVRPGSIETTEQEQFIKKYANHLWSKVKSISNDDNEDGMDEEKKLQSTDKDPTGLKKYPLLTSEQVKCIKDKTYPELIILCGIPGSGKSLFCKMLSTMNKQQRDNQSKVKIVNEWRFANQDELGKKENVDLAVKKWLSAKIGSKIGLVIDRCNVTKNERKHWIELSFKIKKTVAIYFDIDSKICQDRIQKRKNHPTISGRSQNNIARLVRDFTKKLEPPKEKEGFQRIFTIKDTNDLLSVCKTLGCLRELIRHFIPTQFYKFPRTPHLWNTGAATRDDIKLDEKYSKMYYGPNAKPVTVTEKVDGANLGISLSANYEIQCQHRGQQIVYTSSSEYSKLKDWLDRKSKFLCEILEPQKHILFGEWCQCKHSILYDNLPDYFLVFDLFDRHTQKFASRQKLENICKGRFSMTRKICTKTFKNKEQLEKLMNNTMSTYKLKNPGPIEGLYLKIEDNEKGINIHRCKLVRSEFIQGITDHWIHQKLEYNTVRQIYDYQDEEEQKNDENDDNHVLQMQEIKQEAVKCIKKKRANKPRDEHLYYAKMAKSRFAMSQKVICKKLKLDLDKLLNVYVIGSRVWGTATSKSDWDIIIVTDNKNDNVFQSVDNIDAYILDKHQWREELNNHRFVCWLTLFLPESAIWKNDLNISSLNKTSNKRNGDISIKVNGFNYKIFVDTLIKEIEKDCKKLNKFHSKRKMDKVHKTFIHTLRMIEISKQMITLLKENYGTDKIIKCESLSSISFVGMIKFDEIDVSVREKQKELEINGYSNNKQTADIWINELKNSGKECLNLL